VIARVEPFRILLENYRIGRPGGLRPPVISSFLVLMVGEADHEHQKSDLFRGLRPRNPAGEFASGILQNIHPHALWSFKPPTKNTN
jgi:hypothetical protein